MLESNFVQDCKRVFNFLLWVVLAIWGTDDLLVDEVDDLGTIWNSCLDLNDIAISILVLNVLWCSKTLEYSSLHHDAHLCAQCLCLFHGVGGEDHS